ncbi:MAG: ion transporter [Candidatus Riflebacteria bacterium]|nr:ion transporter [Candidatus Riflebacteria bacterium]
MNNKDSAENNGFFDKIYRLFGSLPFGMLVIVAIIISLSLLYAETYIYNLVETVPPWIAHINDFFTYIFVVEIVLLLINIGQRIDQQQKNRIITKLKHFVDSPQFGITVMVLILVSVALIFSELFIYGGNEEKVPKLIIQINEWLTYIFIVELILRWIVSYSTHNFLANYWIDMLAVMPTFRIFRIGRVLRILRVLRLFRVFSIGSEFTRKFRLFGRLFEGRLTEIGIISSFGIFAIFFGAVGLSQFEIGKESEISSVSDAFWKSLFSLMSGEYADYPQTLGGKIVFLILLIFEMGIFAMLTGTFSAIMMDKIKETTMHKHTDPEELNNHIIICGFGQKTIILAREFLIDPIFEDSEILIISEKANMMEELEQHNIDTNRVSILNEDFTSISALNKAGVEKARLAVITSESNGVRSTQDVDARTILAALTIEKLNPKIHTSAEIYNEEFASHLKMGGVEDVVIQGEVSGKLLARISMHEGLLAFFKDLLSTDSGNTLDFILATQDYAGKRYIDVVRELHETKGFTLVGVKPYNQEVIVNPKERIIAANDELLVISPISSRKELK